MNQPIQLKAKIPSSRNSVSRSLVRMKILVGLFFSLALVCIATAGKNKKDKSSEEISQSQEQAVNEPESTATPKVSGKSADKKKKGKDARTDAGKTPKSTGLSNNAKKTKPKPAGSGETPTSAAVISAPTPGPTQIVAPVSTRIPNYQPPQTAFDVILTDAGANKLGVIKEVKDSTGLGLAEAKALVDHAPRPIKEGISKAEADELKKKFEAAGAKVEIR